MKTIIETLIGLIFLSPAIANNVAITNVSLVNENPAQDYTFVQFDISWDNSWRTSTLESNYDAAWVFIKYRLANQTIWHHASLHNTEHVAPAGATISVSADARGVFIHRSANGIGPVSWANIQLRWNYGVNGLEDADQVEVATFAIEMVYIPEAAFRVGDDAIDIAGQFEQCGNDGAAFHITSEAAINLGGAAPANLCNHNSENMTVPDDFDNATVRALPIEFPKGYGAFYCMKYELSQEQYTAFLNRLTRPQQLARASATVVGRFMSNEIGWSVSAQLRNGIRLQSDPGGTNPRVYGNDLNENGIYNEADDGQNIACNWISIQDYLSYLDWSALRPMTELEYEKTCRGTQTPNPDEFAWGNTFATPATGTLNAGTANEVPNNASANCSYGGAVGGPIRAGSFAAFGATRASSGAAYYGAMEMSGNMWEYCVKAGNAEGRAFQGSHGDGVLNAMGRKTNPDWGSDTGTSHAIGLRGSDWLGAASSWLTISFRGFSNWSEDATTRFSTTSVRGVRTAP